MSYSIRTPAGTDRYSLTSDLKIMADDTVVHLESLRQETLLAVRENTSPTFNTITTSSAPTFPSITITGQRPFSKITNDATYGFGLKSENLYFTTSNGTTWTSTGHIVLPNGGTGTQAINRNALDAEITTLNATIAALTTRVAAIENVYASKAYVDGQDSPIRNNANNAQARINNLEATLATKANLYTAANKVYYSQYANDAGSSNYAATANNSNQLSGRRLATGSFYAGTLAGGQSSEMRVTHNLGYSPFIVATAVNDTGVVSIVCSINQVNESTAVVKYRNLNTSTGEECTIIWMAI
jgi:hypothetical protein